VARKRETREAIAGRRVAAFERGWLDSLDGYAAHSVQATEDAYDYARGWSECANYRWADPANRGVAPDRGYRPSN
jgi:hypothetical protein